MRAELITACQMFLVPSTILFAAIGLARTEGLKTGISVAGLVTAVMWLMLVLGWPKLTTLETRTASGLAIVFLLVWLVSTIVHGMLALGHGNKLPEIMRPVPEDPATRMGPGGVIR